MITSLPKMNDNSSREVICNSSTTVINYFRKGNGPGNGHGSGPGGDGSSEPLSLL